MKRLFPSVLTTVSTVVFFLLLISCNARRDSSVSIDDIFPSTQSLKCEMVSGSLECKSPVKGLFSVGDYLIVIAYKHGEKNDTFVHVYDKNDFSLLRDGLVFGRGPGEMSNVSNCSFDYQFGRLLAFDMQSRSAVSIDISRLVSGEQDYASKLDVPSDNNTARVLLAYKDGGIVFINAPENPESDNQYLTDRFVVYDSSSSILSSFAHDYPMDDYNTQMALFSTRSFNAISRDYKKMVVSSENGGLMEVFDLNDSQITRNRINYYFGYCKDILSVCNLSFDTQGKLYACLDFEVPYSSLYDADFDHQTYMHVGIFDSNGTPERLLSSDEWSILSTCVDEGVMYMVVREKETRDLFLAKTTL